MNYAIITGSSSFIGFNLVKELLRQNYFVYAIVRQPEKLEELKKNEHLEIVVNDLCEMEKLPEKITTKADIFYHLAWDGTRGKDRDNKEKQQKNVTLSLQAMMIAKELGCHTFIGSGSQAEYGKCCGQITEEYRTMPITEYGKAKLSVYEKGKKLSRELKIKFVWTRIFSVYGLGDFSGTLVSGTIKKMLRGEPVALTECMQNWDFIHVYDVARAFVKLVDAPGGVYNIASGESQMLKEFVLQMKRLTDSSSELLFGAIPYDDNGAISFEPNVDKIKGLINWKPIVNFEEGIKEIIKEQRKLNG